MTIEAELESVLRAAATEHRVPGAVAGLLIGDETYTAVHGVANAEFPTPVTPASMSQVASITKTFTSAAVMLLVQEGRVRLEDPVARHLPDLGPATGLDFDTITVEHLLSHQAGFDGDYLFVEGSDDLAALRARPPPVRAGRGLLLQQRGLLDLRRADRGAQRPELRVVRPRAPPAPARDDRGGVHRGRSDHLSRAGAPRGVGRARRTCSAGWVGSRVGSSRPSTARPAASSPRSSICSPGVASSAPAPRSTAR